MARNEERAGSSPFEDTGDWPFRESAPPPVEAEGPRPDDPGRTRPFDLDDLAAAQAVSPAAPSEEEAAAAPLVPDESAVAAVEVEEQAKPPVEPEPEPAAEEPVPVLEAEPVAELEPVAVPVEHAPGELRIPDGADVMEGAPNGFRRTVAVVVSRFNADITNRLLEQAFEALTDAHVAKESITVVPVPGAFELPLAAMALAKTRRFSCIVALGCVIRGETSHFDFVASEAASGLQLAGIETGVPVSFGLLTCDTREQAEARIDRAADAARTALEMADLFTHVRARAARSG
jgi:6,7-dimethyl-8-ribityllumazine synthase